MNDTYLSIKNELYEIAGKIAKDIQASYEQNNFWSTNGMIDIDQKIRVMQDVNHAITLINGMN